MQSIFGELDAAGKSWRAYQEGMTSNCMTSNTGRYAVKHNPGAYYVPLRSSCQINDVPMGTTTSGNFVNDINNGTLPNCSFVTPDMCNSTHDCSVGTGDAFLQTWVSKIMAGPDYQRGNTVIIIITWDESGATQAEIVISPSTHGTAESCSPKMARSR